MKTGFFILCFLSIFILSGIQPAQTSEDLAKVPILMYHHVCPLPVKTGPLLRRYTVTPENFEKQMKYLVENNYNVIGLDDLLEHFDNGTPLPPKPIIITFDDGWEVTVKYGLPILKKYNLKAIFFVMTTRFKSSLTSQDYLKLLTHDEVRQLSEARMEIGGHTLYHPDLTKIKNEKARHEIKENKEELERITGKPVRFFAYPFGAYNHKVIELVKEAGYLAAVSTDEGVWQGNARRYILKRLEIHNNFDEFKKLIE